MDINSTLFDKVHRSYTHEISSDTEQWSRLTGTEIIAKLPEVTIYRCFDHSWLFALSSQHSLPYVTADENYENITLYTSGGNNQCEFDQGMRFLLRTAFECRFCLKGIVSLHSACVELDGSAVAFTGDSGMGKSTRAKAWVDALGAQWISGDRPCVRICEKESHACGVPWDGKEQIFRNVEVPLKAILEVRRSHDQYIRRLTPSQARSVLMKQSFMPMWNTELAIHAIENIQKLIAVTPVYRVFCGPDAEDASAVYNLLYRFPERIREAQPEVKLKRQYKVCNTLGQGMIVPAHGNADQVIALNEVSEFICKMMELPCSMEDLQAAILSRYDVSETNAAADLDQLLSQLTELGVIEISPIES